MISTPLHSIVITLQAQDAGSLPITHGHLIHAAFLNILRWVSPQETQALHDSNLRNPFTLSPLSGLRGAKKGYFPVQAGQKTWLRITMMDAGILHDFTTYFIQGHTHIRLDSIRFLVTEILFASQSHNWSRSSSTDTLFAQWATTSLKEMHQTIKLHFRTPTAFHLRGKPNRFFHVLPDPVLVFGELAGYWDGLSGDNCSDVMAAFVQDRVAVSRYQLETHSLRFPESPQLGFTGEVTYTILPDAASSMIRQLNLLADLAFYTGIGHKTGMGMGQVMRRDEE